MRILTSHTFPSTRNLSDEQESRLSCSGTVKKGVDDYSNLHRKESTETKAKQYQVLVNAYYDLATVFYEWGWGSSFHFSYQYPGESFDESIRRHEYYLASQLNITHEKQHVLDVGCGIGGPMRNICRFLQCHVTGITLNPYQVQRGNELTAKSKDAFCRTHAKSVQGDFMRLPFADDYFDGVFAIEATCHAPDRVACYGEIFRVLKPGAIFACYEWCLTTKYDPNNPEHVRMKADIEEGNGLPDITTTEACWNAIKQAGFEPIVERDLALTPDVQPWYTPLTASWNPLTQRFQFNWLGATITNVAIYMLELFWLAPRGTVKTQKILQAGGFALRDAGKEGIFTAMYLIVGRKPLANE